MNPIVVCSKPCSDHNRRHCPHVLPHIAHIYDINNPGTNCTNIPALSCKHKNTCAPVNCVTVEEEIFLGDRS